MDTEPVPLPDKQSTFASKERQLRLVDPTATIIDERLELWGDAARSHHPALFHGGLAHQIARQANLQPEDAIQAVRSEPSPFKRADDLTAQQSLRSKRARDKRELLLRVTMDDALDTLGIEDPDYADYFERIITYQNNPATPEVYQTAIRSLYRLFVQREMIAKAHNEGDFGQFNFGSVLDRLVRDLF